MYSVNFPGGDGLNERAEQLLTWLDAVRQRSRASGASDRAEPFSARAVATLHRKSWRASRSLQLARFKYL